MSKAIFIAFLCCMCASLARGYLDDSLLTEELRDLIAALHKQCTQEVGIENDVIAKTNEGEFPNDNKLKCYMKCILAEGGAMDEDGKLDFQLIEEIVPDKLKGPIKNMFDKCIPEAKNADLCEKSFEFYSCCYKVEPKAYFLI